MNQLNSFIVAIKENFKFNSSLFYIKMANVSRPINAFYQIRILRSSIQLIDQALLYKHDPFCW